MPALRLLQPAPVPGGNQVEARLIKPNGLGGATAPPVLWRHAANIKEFLGIEWLPERRHLVET